MSIAHKKGEYYVVGGSLCGIIYFALPPPSICGGYSSCCCCGNDCSIPATDPSSPAICALPIGLTLYPKVACCGTLQSILPEDKIANVGHKNDWIVLGGLCIPGLLTYNSFCFSPNKCCGGEFNVLCIACEESCPCSEDVPMVCGPPIGCICYPTCGCCKKLKDVSGLMRGVGSVGSVLWPQQHTPMRAIRCH